jgi:hypothetical protein
MDGPVVADREVVTLVRCAVAAALLALHATAAAAAERELHVQGELKGIAIDDRADRWSGGSITVGTAHIVVPARLLIELPGTTLTLQELFVLAPERCRRDGASGLLASDACRVRHDGPSPARAWSARDDTTPRTTLDPEPTGAPPATTARVSAIVARPAPGVNGGSADLVATRIVLTRNDQSVWGPVTFVNEEQGYLRVGGAFGSDQGGAIVRINDPDTRQSAQSGLGCGPEGNCSPDARFRANPERYTVRFEAGYPACVPGGLGGVCAQASRPIRGVVDAVLLVPIRPGDHVTARGAFEVVDGVRVFWAHALIVHTSPVAP